MGVFDYPNRSDEELARRVQDGDRMAFTHLVRRYWEPMLRYGHRLMPRSNDVEDVIQEVFLKAYSNMQGYDSARRFSPWLYRVAHNALIDHTRSRKRDPLPFFDPEELFPHPVANDNPSSDADRAIIKQHLDACVGQLDPKYREPITLRYEEDLSYEDIGAILRIPIGTVSIRIKRGLEKLRNLYVSHHYDQ